MELYLTNKSSIDMTRRLDFNFWQPSQGKFDSSIEVKTLKEWFSNEKYLTTSAFYPAITPYYLKKEDGRGIPFIRVTDTRNLLLNYGSTVFLEKEVLDPLSKSIARVYPGDIVITKGGEYIGEAALVPTFYEEYSICRDVLAVRSSGNSKLSSEYLTAFFRSNFGHNEILKTRSVQGQPHLTLDKMADIKVPYYGDEFESEIISLYQSFFELINESDEHLENAQEILNDYLERQLDTHEDLAIFNLNLTWKQLAQRCDFNYYENKWTNLVNTLKEKGFEFKKIQYVKENLSSGEDTDIYNYITLSDIDERSGTISNMREMKRFELPDRANRMVSVGDVLVSSLKGSKEKVSIVEEMKENLVASTGFYVIRDENYTSEVLYLFFRSKYYDLFIEQMASGSIMSSITEKYFKQFEIPIIPVEIQEKITVEVQSYLEKRNFAFSNLQEASTKFDEKVIDL